MSGAIPEHHPYLRNLPVHTKHNCLRGQSVRTVVSGCPNVAEGEAFIEKASSSSHLSREIMGESAMPSSVPPSETRMVDPM